MQTNYYNEYSHNLNRNMEFKTYGHDGIAFIVFPAQNGRFYDYENFKMVEALSDYIESGRIRLCCVDSVDEETWSFVNGDYHGRILRHEAYFNYINEELYPRLLELFGMNHQGQIYLTGCSMGATHALNFFLRRPDLYKGVIALSGVYHASYFFPNYNDELIYLNSVTDYLPNMPKDHDLLKEYRNSRIVVCVGQGAWEDEAIEDTKIVDDAFKRLSVPAWVDYWGYDVNHDWPWWRTQIKYFMQYFLE